MIDLIIDTLATWRLASLLFREDGPWQVFARLRYLTGVRTSRFTGVCYSDNQIGEMLCCFWCTSIWAAGGVLLSPRPIRRVFALSSLAIFAGWIGLWLDPDEHKLSDVLKRQKENDNGR